MNPVALIATIRLNLLRQPLLKPETVECCLDIDRRKLIELIQSGEIAWAWNIGADGTRPRREVRVLAHCIIERQTGIIQQIGATKNLNLPEVVSLILPKVRPTLRGRELQKLLACTPDTIRNLRNAGALDALRESLPKVGPNASQRYTRESLVKFLQKRRIT